MIPVSSPTWPALAVALIVALGPPSHSAAADGKPAAETPASNGFRFANVDGGSLGLWERGRPVFVYNHGVREHQAAPRDRWRSTYVHPLYGLDGDTLTDDFPRDHYHHRGLFWAWPLVAFDGKQYDLWMLRGIRQQFERFVERSVDAERAVLAIENGWYVGERRIVKEEVRFVVHATRGDERTIDFQLTLTALERPVTLGGAEGKGYGGLSLRFAPRKETTVIADSGKLHKDANLQRLAWADLSARFEGAAGTSGAAILARRQAEGKWPNWITREYGFLGIGWPEAADATLQPGVAANVTYRLVVHRRLGDAARLKVIADDWLRLADER